MSFKTYNAQGQLLLDSEQAVFNFVKSGRLTRLLATPFEQNKREYWYRAKRMYVNSEMRKGQADIHTPEYCMYYIDLPNAISPIAGVYYDGLAKDCNPVVYLNTGYFDGVARLMFYSNGRLSDEELAKFHIYIFDVNVIKEDKVGINLYDRQGNVTFSSRSAPMNIAEYVVYGRKELDAGIYYKSANKKCASVMLEPYQVIYVARFKRGFVQGIKCDFYDIALNAAKDGCLIGEQVSFKNILLDGKREASAKDIGGKLVDDGELAEASDSYLDRGVLTSNKWLAKLQTKPPHQGQALLIDVQNLPFPFN